MAHTTYANTKALLAGKAAEARGLAKMARRVYFDKITETVLTNEAALASAPEGHKAWIASMCKFSNDQFFAYHYGKVVLGYVCGEPATFQTLSDYVQQARDSGAL